jgi:hypothetical protein
MEIRLHFKNPFTINDKKKSILFFNGVLEKLNK